MNGLRPAIGILVHALRRVAQRGDGGRERVAEHVECVPRIPPPSAVNERRVAGSSLGEAWRGHRGERVFPRGRARPAARRTAPPEGQRAAKAPERQQRAPPLQRRQADLVRQSQCGRVLKRGEVQLSEQCARTLRDDDQRRVGAGLGR
eukprot:2698072-Pleurochrysis_carterae.AAC.3